MTGRRITILGIFVADVAFRTPRNPAWGETVIGSGFTLGPGGKGSNQAVAAARPGGAVGFISKLGRDTFGDLARQLYAEEGIDTRYLLETSEHATGAAAIIIDEARGDNAIIVYPGSCSHLDAAEVDEARGEIGRSAVFTTNLELPVPVVVRGAGLSRLPLALSRREQPLGRQSGEEYGECNGVHRLPPVGRHRNLRRPGAHAGLRAQ